MLGWREALTTFSMTDLTTAREALGQGGIRCYYKTKNMMGNTRGRMGTFGMNMDYACQYYLFVKKTDFEKAQFLIGNALRR